jgi:AcrR family transcriptional regulator
MNEESPSKGERTRCVILDAAYSLFVEQGFHATSMRQIAQSAGVALGGIYNHFDSKEQIFDDLLLETHPYRQVLAILQSTPGETMDVFAHNAARAIHAELGRRPDFLKLVIVELSEFKGIHTPHLFQTIFPQFLPLVERFKGSQSRLRDLPPQTILLSFIGMFFSHYLTASIISPSGSGSSEFGAMDQYLDIYLHGILKPEVP